MVYHCLWFGYLFIVFVSCLLTTTMLRMPRISTSVRASLARRTYASTTVQLPNKTHGHLPTSQSPITSTLHFFNSVMEEGKQIPTYRVLDGTGNLIDGAQLPEVSLHRWNRGPTERLLIGLRWTKLLREGAKSVAATVASLSRGKYISSALARAFSLFCD